MFKKILIGLIVVLAVLAVVVQRQPSHFRVERSATLSAPPAVVFEYVNDLHKWQEWSPWARMDPAAKVNYEGPSSGTGAMSSWAGNMKVGTGRMTITDSRPQELVQFKLEFEKPLKGTSTAEFVFKPASLAGGPEGGQTLVTWSMEGENNFINKAMGLVMNCDKMVGGQFEQGLSNLQSVVSATSMNNQGGKS